jgi:plastocyanin
MIDTFDSRGLRFTDCYGQRFMRGGMFRYHVVPAGTSCMTEERPYSIEVAPRAGDGKMKQHNVVVRNDGSSFEVDHARLAIEVGDMVLWNCAQRTAPAFEIAGEAEFFGSARLTNECGYTHAFGAAGEYRWVDAHGSGLRGVVRVHDPGCKSDADLREWRARLSRGTLVTIAEKKVDPSEVDIVTGQTVFFVIVKSRGITVTDERLLGDRVEPDWPRRQEPLPRRLSASPSRRRR